MRHKCRNTTLLCIYCTTLSLYGCCMSYSINAYSPDTHNIPTMPSDTCTPQVRLKRKVTQPAFTRVQSHNFLHSCAITYMRQTHNAHNVLTLTTVTFKTLSTLYVIHICLLRQG